MKGKIPLEDAIPIANRLVASLAHHCHRIEIAGSVRRMRPEVGDLELVAVPRLEERMVASDDLFAPPLQKATVNSLWRHLENIGTRFTKNGPKYRQFAHEGIQVDLFLARPETFGIILLIRTGSAEFSRGMMGKLLRNGHRSQGGAVVSASTGREVATPDEHDVFALAREKWRDPRERH